MIAEVMTVCTGKAHANQYTSPAHRIVHSSTHIARTVRGNGNQLQVLPHSRRPQLRGYDIWQQRRPSVAQEPSPAAAPRPPRHVAEKVCAARVVAQHVDGEGLQCNGWECSVLQLRQAGGGGLVRHMELLKVGPEGPRKLAGPVQQGPVCCARLHPGKVTQFLYGVMYGIRGYIHWVIRGHCG